MQRVTTIFMCVRAAMAPASLVRAGHQSRGGISNRMAHTLMTTRSCRHSGQWPRGRLAVRAVKDCSLFPRRGVHPVHPNIDGE